MSTTNDKQQILFEQQAKATRAVLLCMRWVTPGNSGSVDMFVLVVRHSTSFKSDCSRLLVDSSKYFLLLLSYGHIE